MELNQTTLIIGVVALLIIGFFIFSQATTPMQEQMNAMEQEMEEMMDGEVRVINVDGSEFRFNPSTIRVTKGERVRVVFRNVGTLPHDFVIEGTNIRTRIISPGETDAVEFIADRTGELTFYCSVGNHRANGMEGDLVIE